MASTKSDYFVIDSSNSSPPSESEIYSVAKVAYEKLVEEAALKDQNLRRLVGHANLYDKLLDEYNNCFSDSESDTEDTELLEEEEEFTTQAYSTQNSSKDVSIHVDSTYIYQDMQRVDTENGVRFGDVLISEKEDLELCKVPSHSENLSFHVLGNYAEVEVVETEIFDDD